MSRLEGSCLCGAIQYAVGERFLYAVYCHCSDCRKFSGSAFSVVAGVRSSAFTLTRGDEVTAGSYQKTPASRMRFCTRCGSSLFVEKLEQGMVHVRLGALDSPSPVTPQAHVYVRSKADWYVITDDLPQFEEGPPSEMLEGAAVLGVADAMRAHLVARVPANPSLDEGPPGNESLVAKDQPQSESATLFGPTGKGVDPSTASSVQPRFAGGFKFSRG